MKIFQTKDIREIDRRTMELEPVSSLGLMRRAAARFADEMLRRLAPDTRVEVLAGLGNNGGDAFFVAGFLRSAGLDVRLWHCNGGGSISSDCQAAKEIYLTKNKNAFAEISSAGELPDFGRNAVVVDGLFGSGLNRPLSGFYADVVRKINASGCAVFAIDIPSGLMGEDNSANDRTAIVRARHTFTFQFPKISFLLPENEDFVGEWQTLDIQLHPQAVEQTPSRFFLTDEAAVAALVAPRRRFSHKGTYGHALLVCGSRGKMGAAVLAAKACLRAGVGLLTAHVPAYGVDIMQISVPEAMVSEDSEEKFVSDIYENPAAYNAVGIGPGLGQTPETAAALERFLRQATRPLVLDADALNILAAHREWFRFLPEGSIVTPHPREFDRLTSPSATGYERLQKAVALAAEHKIHVILKGAHTAVVRPDGNVFFNTTGNPGMATAGSGDVLCGVVTSLLAQGRPPFEAALLGVYFHGKAGDEAARHRSQSALLAGDIADFLRMES